MSRTLTAAMQTAISAKEGYADVWFIEIITGDPDGSVQSTLRYATAPDDVLWDSKTWTGIGGVIEFEPPPETTDPSGQSLNLKLSGVDTGLINEILDYELRGRTCRLYWGQILISTGVVVVDALEMFSGLMNASWNIAHTPSDVGTRGSVDVSTTIVSEMARHLFRRMVRTNPTSLALMQARADKSPGTAETFFSTLPALMGQPVYWGRVGARANPGAGYESFYYGGEH